MKKKLNKILVLALFLMLQISANAQQTIVPVENALDNNQPKTNVYYKDVNNVLSKFVGTWVYDSSPYYLKITVIKVINKAKSDLLGSFYTGNVNEDLLEVRYQFMVNGVEKYNTLSYDEDHFITNGNNFMTSNLNKINMHHSEPSLTSCYRGRLADLILEYITSSTIGVQPTLKWDWKYEAGRETGNCPDGTAIDNSSFIMPRNIILTKQ